MHFVHEQVWYALFCDLQDFAVQQTTPTSNIPYRLERHVLVGSSSAMNLTMTSQKLKRQQELRRAASGQPMSVHRVVLGHDLANHLSNGLKQSNFQLLRPRKDKAKRRNRGSLDEHVFQCERASKMLQSQLKLICESWYGGRELQAIHLLTRRQKGRTRTLKRTSNRYISY